MATLSEAIQIGVRLHQAGRLDLAAEIYRRVLAVEPNHADALHLLGVIAHQMGQHANAVDAIGRAIALNPAVAVYHGNLGEAYRALQRTAEAIACYRRAIELDPSYAEAYNDLGLALQAQRQLAEAIACHRRALELNPDYAEAHNNLGIAFKEQGKLGAAIACYQRALELTPASAGVHVNLGVALQQQGRLDMAVACYRRALELDPGSAEGHVNLGVALQELGRLDEAVACQRRAIELQPDFAKAHLNLGNALKDQGNLDEALACDRRALELDPGCVEAHSNLLYTLHYSPAYDAQAICAEHGRWNQQHAEPLARFIRPHGNDRSADRRLRLGYVSPDFRAHPLAQIGGPLLAAHDHQQFAVHCYADVVVPDDMTARFRSWADVWRDIAGRTDEAVADLVRQDGIDILVDLSMHMAHHRLLVFARKPAPVQVAWFAYPSTTGLVTIDYRLTDPYLDPVGVGDECYAEESIRLPDCFWCYDPQADQPAVNGLPAAENGCITFGCLNNFCKINPAVVRLWAEVLKAVERSRLLVLAKEGSHRQRFLDQLQREGVGADRAQFVGLRSRNAYLQLYHQVDIALDTFPYNGHTTTLDALWMGVPVVTRVGTTAVSRAGLSLLGNLGRPELAADTPERFVQVAAELAGDLPRLASLRASLRDEMRRSPLMDGPRFARNMEAAYRMLWQRWCSR